MFEIMHVTSKSGRVFLLNGEEEEARILAALIVVPAAGDRRSRL
jgi:hypothetical protein